MKRVASILALALLPSAALAQIQPGPNLTPNGLPFLYAPRAGYLGPPVAMHRAERAPYPVIYPRTGGVSIPVPAAVPVASPPPPPTARNLLLHNGSLMELIGLPAGMIEIRYVEPRPGLWGVGVRPGTLLIRGQWNGAMLNAQAFVFSFCGATPYPVSGGVDLNNVLMLTGLAPIVDPYSCGVLSAAPTHNSVLVFVPA
jgi:hypothetical protein